MPSGLLAGAVLPWAQPDVVTSNGWTAFWGVVVGAAVTLLVAAIGEWGRWGKARWDRTNLRADQRNDHQRRLLVEVGSAMAAYRKAGLDYQDQSTPERGDDVRLAGARTDLDVLRHRIADDDAARRIESWALRLEAFIQEEATAAQEQNLWAEANAAVGRAIRGCE